LAAGEAVRRRLAWASAWSDAVLANSESARRYHAELGYHPRRWEIVPNGFYTDLFRPDADHRATESGWGSASRSSVW
jgi:glycosyltransferase involved in cell wall biosynthesis